MYFGILTILESILKKTTSLIYKRLHKNKHQFIKKNIKKEYGKIIESYSKKIMDNKINKKAKVQYKSWNICKELWSNFFLCSGEKNMIIGFVRDALLHYLERNNNLIATDVVMTVGSEELVFFKKDIDLIPINNELVFQMESTLNSFGINENLLSKTYVNKLSYKHPLYDEIKGKKLAIIDKKRELWVIR